MLDLISALSDLSTPARISASILPVLFAITVHEVAHGWMAKQLGDPTAQRLGRLTLNPIKHIDPIGTVLLPAMLIFLRVGFVFGWAKPVPVTWENLHHPKRDMVLVALAGPVSNFFMALIWGLVAKIGIALDNVVPWAAEPLFYTGIAGIVVNVLLMVFNLLPLPPLDGGRVAVGLLPSRWGWALSRVEPFGFFILLALMISELLWVIVLPISSYVTIAVRFIVGLT